MNDRFSHSGGPEQLPTDFPQSLRDVDALLAKQARQISAPVGLADRVFAASRPALMAATTPVESAPRLRLVPAPRPIHQSPWARLAMAACVAMAFVIAFWALQPSQPHAPHVVSNTHNQPNSDSRIDMLASAVDAPHATSASHYEANITYLMDSNDLGAEDLDDLKSELAMLVARF